MIENPKKKRIEDDDELDENINEFNDDEFVDDELADDVEDDADINEEIIKEGEDDDIDIVIEIDEDDLNITDEKDIILEVEDPDEIILSKHKLEGKHSLKYDSIFKGKKEEVSEEEMSMVDFYQKDTIEVDKSSNYYFESIDNEKYIRAKLLKEKVYEVLSENTSINFLNNRRKPSRVDFNQYYDILKENLQKESFTNIELFNELAVYFSDNLFNMFKLLDKKWRNMIIIELEDHIGKCQNSKEVSNRNIYVGTEVEFEWFDEFANNNIIITGDVVEVDYELSCFRINSYERIYDINLTMITKILNNTKFRYNINKLNNIDFL